MPHTLLFCRPVPAQPPCCPHCLKPACRHACLQVPADQLHMLKGAIGHRFAAFEQEFGKKEPGLSITATPAATIPATCLTAAGGQQLLDLLLTLPHGVIKNSHAVPGACALARLVASQLPPRSRETRSTAAVLRSATPSPHLLLVCCHVSTARAASFYTVPPDPHLYTLADPWAAFIVMCSPPSPCRSGGDLLQPGLHRAAGGG